MQRNHGAGWIYQHGVPPRLRWSSRARRRVRPALAGAGRYNNNYPYLVYETGGRRTVTGGRPHNHQEEGHNSSAQHRRRPALPFAASAHTRRRIVRVPGIRIHRREAYDGHFLARRGVRPTSSAHAGTKARPNSCARPIGRDRAQSSTFSPRPAAVRLPPQ